jgi:hypothetical protein
MDDADVTVTKTVYHSGFLASNLNWQIPRNASREMLGWDRPFNCVGGVSVLLLVVALWFGFMASHSHFNTHARNETGGDVFGHHRNNNNNNNNNNSRKTQPPTRGVTRESKRICDVKYTKVYNLLRRFQTDRSSSASVLGGRSLYEVVTKK